MSICATDIERVLSAALQPTQLEVQDDSHLHAGHAGAKEGRHFTVRLTSARFDGLNRVARHRQRPEHHILPGQPALQQRLHPSVMLHTIW